MDVGRLPPVWPERSKPRIRADGDRSQRGKETREPQAPVVTQRERPAMTRASRSLLRRDSIPFSRNRDPSVRSGGDPPGRTQPFQAGSSHPRLSSARRVGNYPRAAGLSKNSHILCASPHPKATCWGEPPEAQAAERCAGCSRACRSTCSHSSPSENPARAADFGVRL